MTSFAQYNNFQPPDPNMSGPTSTMTLDSIWQEHRVGILFVASVFGVMLVMFIVLMLLKGCEKRCRNKVLQRKPDNLLDDASMWHTRQHYQRLRGSKCPDELSEAGGDFDVGIVVLSHENDGVVRGAAAEPASAVERQSAIVGPLHLMRKLLHIIGENLKKAKQSKGQDEGVGKPCSDIGDRGDDLLQVVTTPRDDCKTCDVDPTSASG